MAGDYLRLSPTSEARPFPKPQNQPRNIADLLLEFRGGVLGILNQSHGRVPEFIDADDLSGNLGRRIVLLLGRRRGAVTGFRDKINILHQFFQSTIGTDGVLNRLRRVDIATLHGAGCISNGLPEMFQGLVNLFRG